MRLFRVDFKDKIRPPILIRGKTKAQVALDMKEKYGEYILKVDYISHEDAEAQFGHFDLFKDCLLYTSPSPRARQKRRMPSS